MQIMTIEQVKKNHGLQALYYTAGTNPNVTEAQVAKEVDRAIKQITEDGIGGA